MYSNYAIFGQAAAVPTIVPSMTEWGMIILMILAGLGAMYRLRRQRRTGAIS